MIKREAVGISPSEFLLRELRRRRSAAGLTQIALGELVHVSDTYVSAVETGTRPPKPDYLHAVDQALGTGGLFLTVWQELVKDEGAPVWLREWIEIEREAATLRWYEPAFVPGLLQTEAYARTTLLAGGLFSADEVEHRVATRIQRQSVLSRADPPHLTVILDQAVLERTVDDDRLLMTAQLEHILSCADLPRVQILVVPRGASLYPGLAGAFVLARLPDGSTVANLDHQIGALVTDNPDDIARLDAAWDRVHGEALPRRASLDLIKEVARKWI